MILICEAGTLVLYRGYLKKHGWTLCFNDAQDLCCLAGLGKDGTIKQIAGPQEESREAIWNGPNRPVSFAIFEITSKKAFVRKTFASSPTGYFSRHEQQDLEDMT